MSQWQEKAGYKIALGFALSFFKDSYLYLEKEEKKYMYRTLDLSDWQNLSLTHDSAYYLFSTLN